MINTKKYLPVLKDGRMDINRDSIDYWKIK
ncbi:hypothetical protein BDD30_3745 [Photorhabdus asymbiotica]|uniref:Uncharacterized protein n=1 Tax=Photorhabdus asymbiotica TaxID=291112 RepID=A0ABX9SIZ7_9GAMM|nr:hypothetical protein BDD30_3745 [Photorhabdus asymbiotica]